MWPATLVVVLLAFSVLSGGQIGVSKERCLLPDGGAGLCTRTSWCYRDDFLAGPPPACPDAPGDGLPRVCCPLQPVFNTTVDRYCDYIMTHLHKLAPKSRRKRVIMGGATRSSMLDRPYMALVGFGKPEEIEWGCGGSLINSRFVLSAAHCIEMGRLGLARWVRLGSLYGNTERDAESSPQDREIVQIFRPSEYNRSLVYNDIALFRLDRPVLFSPWVSPVCLNTKREERFSTAVASGWGRLHFVGPVSRVLMEGALQVFSEDECSKYTVVSETKLPRGVDHQTMFCSGFLNGTRDTCPGDSGGPLVTQRNGAYHKQIGIISSGSECMRAFSPGLYTRVSAYVSWIDKIAFKEEIIPH